jgi:hypothetical protein
VSLFGFLASLIDALDAVGVPHMVSGSLASARHGESRATQDIDVVIDPTAAQISDLARLFEAEDWYVGDGSTALSRRSEFNVIDPTSGWKADLIIRKDRPYSLEEFSRRRRVTVGGIELWMVTAEDSILSKLEWAADSRSDRQLRDVASVIRQQRDSLDWDYLASWATELRVADLLAEVSRTAD